MRGHKDGCCHRKPLKTMLPPACKGEAHVPLVKRREDLALNWLLKSFAPCIPVISGF
jgi:hypothetical protein